MKKLLFIFLLLPTIVFGQAVVQQSKTPASGTNAGNQYFSWYSGAFNGYFIPPYGSNATLNRTADINGLFYIQLSDSTIRFRYNGSWIPIGKGGSSGAVYFSSTYFGGLGTVGSPITIIPSSVLPSQTGQSGKFLTTNGTTTSWSSAAGGSTGVNGLNGTANIGLGGTLTGLTYIQNGGYIFKVDSLQILNNPVNGYNAVNLNYLNSKAIYFASGTFTGSGTVGSPYALNVSTSPSSGSTLPVTSGGVYTALGNYVTIAAPQLTTSSTTNYVWTATDGAGHGSWQVASGGFTNPMTTLGDIIYGGSSGTATRLAGNSTTTTKFLTSTGSGSAATAPSYFDLFNTANTWGAAQTISTSSGLGTKTQLIFTDGTTGYFNSGTNGFSITESTLRIGYAASTDTYPSGNYPFLQINSNPVASPQFHFSTGTSLSNIGYQFFDGGGTIDFNFSTATTASITAQGGYNLALGKSSSETSTVTAAMTVLFNTTNDIIFGPSPVDAPTALVKIQSTTQGFLTPVMTENQRNLIATITSLTIQLPGTGYTNGTYTLAFSGGGGSGAAGTCTVSGGSITSYNLTNGGKGYTSVPTVSITGGSFTANSITANIAMASSSNALLVYNSTTSKFNYFDYSTTQWRPLLDSARGGGGGSGTVTSITPGWSFTSTTPITTSGTLTEDSTKVQTVANFFPKGDTRYLKSSVFNSLTQYSVPIATGSGITQDNSNFYYNYSNHELHIGTNGDFTGTNAINIYGQLDAYEPQSSIGGVTSGTAYPGVTASTSRGTGASPLVDNSGDNAGGFSGWIYTGASPNYLYAAGISISAQGVTSSLGGQLDFYTKADGSTTTTSAMTITPSGQVKINGGLTAPAKMTLGTVVNNNLLVSTGYTSAGSTTTWAFTSSGLTFSGGSNDNSNTQTYTSYYTNATNYSTSITFKPTSYGNGIGIGLNSNNGQIIGRMSLTSGGTGTLYIDVYRSATIYNKVTGSNTLAFALNDNIQLTLSRFNYDWYLFANDLTSGVSVSCQVNDPLTYGEIAFEYASANPFILAYGGAGTITNHNLAIGNYVQNDFVIVGNSIAVGIQSGNPNATFASLLGQYYSTGVNLEAGGGNTTATDVQLLPEIVALKPRFLIFTDGVNDAINAVPAATSEANMQTIITTCISNNITPIFCTILPVSSTYGGASNATIQAAIVTLNTYINGLKNITIIDTYTALSSASVLNPSYDSGDGIHINTAGHLVYYNTLYTTLSGNYMVNITPNPTTAILSTANNWTGNPQTLTINGLGTTTSDAWKFTNTTAATSGTQQYSPDLHFNGNAWNTTSLASQSFDWKMFATGTAGNPIASNVYLSSSLNGGAYVTNQYGWSALGVYTAPTFSSTSTGGGSAFQSYNASATGSNLYVLAAGGNTLGVAATNFAGASNINYRWFMSGGTAITPGGGNAVTGGIIGTQHVTYPSTGTTPLISQLVIKPLVVDGSSGAIVTNTATLDIEGASSATVSGANYSIWAHGLSRLDSLATNVSGLLKGNGNASPVTAAVAGTDYVGLASTNVLTGFNTFNPSITASANLAQGIYVDPTLTAAANNDVLVGADFAPVLSGVGIISTLGSVTGGSLYTNGTYPGVPLTGGNGSGAQATVVVSGGAVSTVTITTAGTRYDVNDVLSAAAANIGGTGSGFSVPVATLTRTVTGAPLRATVTNIGQGSSANFNGSWADGLLLYNSTAAVSTLSQNSPVIHLSSFGWGSTGGTSQAVDAFIYSQANTGTVPNANLTFAFGVAGAKTTAAYTFGSGGAATFTSGSLTLTRSSQGATAFNSLIQQNTTAATSGTPNQWTPTWYNEGAVWNTSGTPASNSFAFGLIGEGTSSANPYATQYFQTYLGTSTTPTFVNTMSLTTQGQLSLGLANTNIQAGSQAGSIFNIGASTVTDNSTASGTVTNFAVIGTGLTTLAATNASITYTNGYGAFFTAPQAGTNVTMTNKYALGLAYDATHLATFAVSSAGLLTINATSTITITPATTFSTTVSGPTASTLTNTTQLATTAYVINNVLTKRTAQAINATATATAAQMAAGYITSTSAAATTITFQTATAYATGLGAAAGSTADLYIDNTAGANTVTIVLGSGMTGVNSPSLTVSTGASGIALYHFTFSSTSACTVVRLQ